MKGTRIATSYVNEEVVIIERLELDLDVGRLHNLVELAVLLARDEFSVLVRELNLEADLVMERLDEVEFENELDRFPDFGFETMKLETVTLEHGFGAARDADVPQDGRNLSGIDR